MQQVRLELQLAPEEAANYRLPTRPTLETRLFFVSCYVKRFDISCSSKRKPCEIFLTRLAKTFLEQLLAMRIIKAYSMLKAARADNGGVEWLKN
jgi:hypothetical protein